MGSQNNKKSIWTNILIMGVGTISAQLVNILVQPILTRILTPEVLGIYTFIITLATMIIPVASLKLDMLIVTEKDDNEAQYITDTCILIVLFISILYFIIIGIGYNVEYDNVFNKYGMVVYVVPIIILINGLRFLFISYNNRYEQYRLISIIGIIRETSRACIQLALGYITGGVFGQAVGYGISPLFGLKLQVSGYLQKKKNRPRITISQIKNIILNKGFRQIAYLVPAQFINNFSASFIIISVTYLFSATELGYYSVGTRILDIPIMFITANVSKVCYQKINELVKNDKPVFDMLYTIISVLFIISAVGFCILYFIAPYAAELFFGKGYYIAGLYIRCMCIMYAIRMVATSFSGICTIFNKQFYELILNIVLILCAVIVFGVCKIMNLDIFLYLKLLSIGYGLTYSLMLVGYMFLAWKHDRKLNSLINKV